MSETVATQSPERLFGTMARIRAFEEQVSRLYADGLIPGFVHVSTGQEAIAAGVAGQLRPEDRLSTSHRGHGHVIAKGGDLRRMMAELLGRQDGYCHGKGGSMHIMDASIGVLGANGIVGAGVPMAVGAALAAQLTQSGGVVASFFGEGAINQGMTMEAWNLAAVWNLPVLFVCENNQFAEFTDSRLMSRVPSASGRAAAFGIDAVQVDGNDAVEVDKIAAGLLEQCRTGGGPKLLEAMTYRHHGHYEGDPQKYKEEKDNAHWTARDPLVVGRVWFADPAQPDRINANALAEVAEAVNFASSSPLPEAVSAFEDVYG
jgi:TPP-dependent pyruvate/acetoin dehydrogenase alpha subunit